MLVFAIAACGSLLGAVFWLGMPGLYCLVATSAFMSLMFPTIYGIALHGLGDDAKLGSAGLVMAIVGGALMPPLQGSIIDLGMVGGMDAVRVSFLLPLFCFAVLVLYAWFVIKRRENA